jgi:endonuclease G
MARLALATLGILAFLALASAQGPTRKDAVAALPGDIHLALGNPSHAMSDSKDPNDFLMVKPQFALSYNNKQGTPNWVSYYLKKADMGRAPRSQMFFPDGDLPRAFHRVLPGDYFFNATGMTRGHMCPSSHRNNTEANARATFVMTNMVPQTEELNGGSWELLERYCRALCFDEGKELMIVSGPHGQGGVSNRGLILTVGNGQVIVPKTTWKVVLVMEGGGTRGPLARVNAKSRLIAVSMPNTREPNENVPWTKYVVSAAEIELMTGLRFFEKVPPEIIGPLKKKVDRGAN